MRRKPVYPSVVFKNRLRRIIRVSDLTYSAVESKPKAENIQKQLNILKLAQFNADPFHTAENPVKKFNLP